MYCLLGLEYVFGVTGWGFGFKQGIWEFFNEVIIQGVSIFGLVVIFCVVSGYIEVFGKIKVVFFVDKRKDKV